MTEITRYVLRTKTLKIIRKVNVGKYRNRVFIENIGIGYLLEIQNHIFSNIQNLTNNYIVYYNLLV
jgi:hypothetical protein